VILNANEGEGLVWLAFLPTILRSRSGSSARPGAWMWRSMRGTPWNRPAGTGDKIQLFVPGATLFGITAAGSRYLPYQAHVGPVRSGVEISGEPESDGAWT
jgi:hypothetical protein